MKFYAIQLVLADSDLRDCDVAVNSERATSGNHRNASQDLSCKSLQNVSFPVSANVKLPQCMHAM